MLWNHWATSRARGLQTADSSHVLPPCRRPSGLSGRDGPGTSVAALQNGYCHMQPTTVSVLKISAFGLMTDLENTAYNS